MPNDIYVCNYCGKEFIPSSSTIAKIKRGEQKNMTCSKECCNQLKRKTIITHCDNCGKEISRKKSHYERQIKLGQHQYCCLKCQKEYIHNETYEIRTCEICGNEFECAKISSQRFCSTQCQGKWQSTITGDNNPRNEKIHHNCEYCGKPYLMKKYKLKQEHNFCSFKCQRDWFNTVFNQTEEYKQECRSRAIKMLQDGKMPFVYTKPQLIINEILDNHNIQYQNDYDVKYYSIDNYLTNNGLMIEVMGDYWHSNPNIFNLEKLNDIQRKRVSRDKAKHTYIKTYYDIEILYLWENDIYKNLQVCKELIMQYIKCNGKLNNYHSFNYHIGDNNNIQLNDNIHFAYFDE